jgi:hypothetical protein
MKCIGTGSISAGCSFSTHTCRTLFLFVCVILLHLCVLIYECVRAGLLIGPALLNMCINKLINNIIIIVITTIVVPKVAGEWLGLLFGRFWVQIKRSAILTKMFVLLPGVCW